MGGLSSSTNYRGLSGLTNCGWIVEFDELRVGCQDRLTMGGLSSSANHGGLSSSTNQGGIVEG
ncbi:hypothetical protein QJS04_geneDACA017291 [Acorus gramineus]|uniref:Uncharacterized protein n=1 Tax=Acorus gramineus TaxID=55184 RepID=A0AAV9A2T8_ACOGR|nr:hypothetical protein QJS04_geneDACA017291 [Acorus gramineus]